MCCPVFTSTALFTILYRITEQLLQVFARYNDLGLLVIQTRSPLVARDLDLIASIRYAYLSVTIETDDQGVLKDIKPGSPTVQVRREIINRARMWNIHTQVTVSPCLPHTPGFAGFLLQDMRPDRIVVDTFVSGDGSRGERTKASPIAQIAAKLKWDWTDEKPAIRLFHRLREAMGDEHVGWSSSGFCGIPSFPAPIEQGVLVRRTNIETRNEVVTS